MRRVGRVGLFSLHSTALLVVTLILWCWQTVCVSIEKTPNIISPSTDYYFYQYGFNWISNEILVKVIFTVHATSCVYCMCFFITPVCFFPDVQMDTLARDAYRLSRCGCTCRILSKVCSLAMNSREQRHSWHWIISVDPPCCPSYSYLVLLPLSPTLSQVVTQRAVHCTV